MGVKEDSFDFPAFLASAAHDMKNSLGMLLNGLDEVASTCSPDTCPSHAALLQMRYDASRISGDLIQLLALYKMDRNQLTATIADHPVEEFLEECYLRTKPVLDFRGIECTINCAPDLVWFFDANLLSGAINNVLGNALRFARKRIAIGAVQREGRLDIVIEDDGEGYPEDLCENDLKKCREVSFSSGSTGLGLYFSSMIAALHRNKGREGRIAVSNGGSLGGGCFRISLP
jgi:signal transduction histidine kinase